VSWVAFTRTMDVRAQDGANDIIAKMEMCAAKP
jgi:hypothetical protein